MSDDICTLVCLYCQLDLSRPIKIDRTVRSDQFYLGQCKANEFCCEPGAGVVATMTYWTGHFHGEGQEVREDRIWMNIADIVTSATLDKRLGIGCCGPAGQLNTRCQCGQLIGRDYRDCLHAHYFSPEPEFTEWVVEHADPAVRESERLIRLSDASRRRKLFEMRHNKK